MTELKSLIKVDAEGLSASLHMCHLWGGRVFVSSPSLPSSCFPVLCVCPAHPLPFKPPFTMTIAAYRDTLPCIALTTAGYWQGPIHSCNPPRAIKSLAGPARPPCKQPNTTLVVSAGYTTRDRGRIVELLGLCTGFCLGWKRRGFVLYTQ